MSEKKSKKQKITLLAFITLLVGAVGLFFNVVFKINILSNIVQFLMFMLASIVGYDIIKDGKPFFSSFYKIAYTLSVIAFAVFIIIPFVNEVIQLVKA